MARGVLGGIHVVSAGQLGIIRRGVLDGLSSRLIQDALSAGGIGIRRTILLEKIRDIKSLEITSAPLRFMRKDRRPDPARLFEAKGMIRRQFGFNVRLRGEDPESGEKVTQWVTVSTNENLSRAQIEERATTLDQGYGREETFTLTDATLWEGYKAGPMGRFE